MVGHLTKDNESDNNTESSSPPGDYSLRFSEIRKRRREILTIFFVAVLFISLSWFEMHLFQLSEQLPFAHAIFFFGLVNFNIILILLLLYLIFRNLVKAFIEKKGRIFGSSLRSKLITAFVGFSTVPTVLLLSISLFYVNSSFDKWFSGKMISILKSSLEVTTAYYNNAKKKNYHFAHLIASEIESMGRLHERVDLRKRLRYLRAHYRLDVLEYYPSLQGSRMVFIPDDESIPIVPRAPAEFLEKGINSQSELSTIIPFGEGNLVRVIVPVRSINLSPSSSLSPSSTSSRSIGSSAVVVSSFVPLSLTSRMNDIATAYDEFSGINPLSYPLKSIYMIILVLMTLMILLAATWFGFYMAKHLSVPLVQLGRATKRVAGGHYDPVVVYSGSEEVNSLVDNFNQMTKNLFISQTELREANTNLEKTLQHMDQHRRYVEVVLGAVSAGVISVDETGKITTMNHRAGQLLRQDPEDCIGKSVGDLMTLEDFHIFVEMMGQLQLHHLEGFQRELIVQVQGESIPLQMSLSLLKNEEGELLGKILVFDDMTPLVNAQRAQAWTEVARRIAHEIKNPLTPIKLSAERLQRKFGESIGDPAFYECTQMIITQTEDLKNLVNEFNQFARLPQARLRKGFLAKVLEEVVSMFRHAHPQIQMTTSVRGVTEFQFDPDQMKRVLVNLFDNAVAAVEGEASPRIETSIEGDLDLGIIKLIIRDNGRGISSRDRGRIFEPYFTSKKEGTGLGLAIVRRIIEDHHGFIRSLPNSPRGTQMIIEFPMGKKEVAFPGEPQI